MNKILTITISKIVRWKIPHAISVKRKEDIFTYILYIHIVIYIDIYYRQKIYFKAKKVYISIYSHDRKYTA